MSKQVLDSHRQLDELVINWHITEACNYRCKYCYSTWSRPNHAYDLCRSRTRTRQFLSSLRAYFDSSCSMNPLTRTLSWRSLRLSIAGGEATLYNSRLPEIVGEAKELGFEVSLISNGSFFTNEMMQLVTPNLAMLGVSIDSVSPTTNLAIGRVQQDGSILDTKLLVEHLSNVRALHPALKLKINTVVNAANVYEDLTPWIRILSPERWKVLRVLPVVSDALSVTDEQFQQFVLRHAPLTSVMSVEDNDDMTESYIMLDPYGRFFQNSGGGTSEPYCFSDPVGEVGVHEAFSQVRFSAMKFVERYQPASSSRREA